MLRYVDPPSILFNNFNEHFTISSSAWSLWYHGVQGHPVHVKHDGQNRGKQKSLIKLNKHKLNESRGIYKFCRNRGEHSEWMNVCNMLHWFRGMDAPDGVSLIVALDLRLRLDNALRFTQTCRERYMLPSCNCWQSGIHWLSSTCVCGPTTGGLFLFNVLCVAMLVLN